MVGEQPVPREVKAVDTASLLALEERAHELRLNSRLDPALLRAHAAPEGTHYLWPALWNTLSHRPDVPRQLRCELLIALRAGERVVGWLDVLPDDFAPLPRVTSRAEGGEVARFLDRVPPVRDWLLGEDPGRA
ncbi:hypothetical protein SNE510_18810 [Streptomyces sp. NE5-10]|uniref:hypothetical protein n=1 Tax=Streptomyces sp. NE5-10 TaxID=2759674 RepID=UPI001908D31E|nr:hypothetical protein [Streptomyces sp. NE5-10]GHJ92362.1 hypothetical protein SNE510_18810 [Streptomyces sp. NE5-10]